MKTGAAMNPESESEVHYMTTKVEPEDARKQLDKMIAEGSVGEVTLAELFGQAFGPKPLRNIIKERVPKLSADEQQARRVLKRHKRQRAAERRTACQRGTRVSIQRAKEATKARRASVTDQDS